MPWWVSSSEEEDDEEKRLYIAKIEGELEASSLAGELDPMYTAYKRY